MVERFKIEILEDAADFLDKLDEKSRDKVIYNITKAKFSTDTDLLKKPEKYHRVRLIKQNG